MTFSSKFALESDVSFECFQLQTIKRLQTIFLLTNRTIQLHSLNIFFFLILFIKKQLNVHLIIAIDDTIRETCVFFSVELKQEIERVREGDGERRKKRVQRFSFDNSV